MSPGPILNWPKLWNRLVPPPGRVPPVMTQFALQMFVGAELGETIVRMPPDAAVVGEIAVAGAAVALRKKKTGGMTVTSRKKLM